MMRLQAITPLFRFARITKKKPINPIEEESKHAIISELDDRCLISVEGADARKYSYFDEEYCKE